MIEDEDYMKLKHITTFLFIACLSGPQLASADPSYVSDVIYARKDGMALTYDIIRPENPNGAAVIFMMSGGWYSSWTPPSRMAESFSDMLNAGFTMIPVYHGSAPKYKIPDAVQDVSLATLHIKENADDYGIDVNRIGVTGGSAGGHLSLMVGLAKEQVAASSVANDGSMDASLAAIVAYFPPVDFRQSESEAAGIVNEVSMEELYSRFPALSFEEDLIPSVSPITFVDQNDPPTLLIHGDADPLVHVSNSVVMNKKLTENSVETDLIIIPGGKHGFGGDNSVRANQARLEWFKTHLLD